MSHHALTLKVSGQILVLRSQVLLAGEGVLLILRVGGGGFPGDGVHHIPRHVLVCFSYQQLLTHTGLVQVVQEQQLQSTDKGFYQVYIFFTMGSTCTKIIFFNNIFNKTKKCFFYYMYIFTTKEGNFYQSVFLVLKDFSLVKMACTS